MNGHSEQAIAATMADTADEWAALLDEEWQEFTADDGQETGEACPKCGATLVIYAPGYSCRECDTFWTPMALAEAQAEASEAEDWWYEQQEAYAEMIGASLERWTR